MLPSNGYHISGMSSPQLSTSSRNPTPSPAGTTATPPSTPISSIFHTTGMSSSQLSNTSGKPAPSSAVTTATPPSTSINSVGYPIPQQVPFGYGYASHHQGHNHVLQQPVSYYQWPHNYQQQWNPQSNAQYNYLPYQHNNFHPQPISHSTSYIHRPHHHYQFHQPHPSYPQPTSQSKNQEKEVSKRHRVKYTSAQLVALEERFEQNNYISMLNRVELGKTLGVSEQQVKIWFKNRRIKARNSKKSVKD